MRPTIVVLIALATAVVPASALASRHASHAQRHALRHAVKHSHLVPPSVRRGHFRLSRPRISTKGPWARAGLVPRGADIGEATGIFRRKHGHWRLADVGTAETGCHLHMRRAVRRDLKVTCP